MDKVIIDKEITSSLVQIFSSKSHDDIELANSIIENRDKTNEESEKLFINDFLNVMIEKENYFYENNFVIKFNGRLMTLYQRSAFKTKHEAVTFLKKYFNSYIGKGKWYPDDIDNSKMSSMNNKQKLQYIAERQKHFEDNIYAYKGGSVNPNYFKILRKIFKGGSEMADYLILNKIIVIEKI